MFGRRTGALVLASALLCGCDDPDKALEEAVAARDRGELEAIVQEHPGAEAAQEAQAYIAEIDAWEQVSASVDGDAVSAFLSAYPDGLFSVEARDSMDDIERWREASSLNSLRAYQSYVQDLPDGAFADRAQARVTELAPRVEEIEQLEAALAAEPDRAQELVPQLEELIVAFIKDEGVGERFVVPGTSATRSPSISVTAVDRGGAAVLQVEFPTDRMSFGVSTNGLGGPDPFAAGSIIRLSGAFPIGDYEASSEDDLAHRLTFGSFEEFGFVYVRGRGEIRDEAGNVTTLGD